MHSDDRPSKHLLGLKKWKMTVISCPHQPRRNVPPWSFMRLQSLAMTERTKQWREKNWLRGNYWCGSLWKFRNSSEDPGCDFDLIQRGGKTWLYPRLQICRALCWDFDTLKVGRNWFQVWTQSRQMSKHWCFPALMIESIIIIMSFVGCHGVFRNIPITSVPWRLPMPCSHSRVSPSGKDIGRDVSPYSRAHALYRHIFLDVLAPAQRLRHMQGHV